MHIPLVAEEGLVKKYKDKLASKAWKHDWNPKYAAMVQALDQSVGRVLDKIEELNLSENTLIIFSSDNGGVAEVTPLHHLRGAKGSFYEGGVRVATCMSWPKLIPAGSHCNTAITSVDFMPTFAELSQAKLPEDQAVDGVSIVPLMKGSDIPERSIYWHYPLYLEGHNKQDRVVPIAGTEKPYWRAAPASLICRGDWKLFHYIEDDRVELYNLREDSSESKNLATQHPEVAANLLRDLNAWRRSTMAPMPNQLNPAFQLPNKH